MFSQFRETANICFSYNQSAANNYAPIKSDEKLSQSL